MTAQLYKPNLDYLKQMANERLSMTYLQFYQKYQALPPVYQAEVADFVDFLASRKAPETPVVRKTPVFGSAKGQFQMSPDFDDPIADFADYQ